MKTNHGSVIPAADETSSADAMVAYSEELAEAFYIDLKAGADPVALRRRLLQESTIAALDAAVARLKSEEAAG